MSQTRRSGTFRTGCHMVVAALVALAMPRLPTQGQASASLAGIVWDQAQATPIVGASVRIVQLNRDVRTDTTGRFWLGSMPPGRYTVEIRRMGYATMDTSINVAGESVAIIRVRASAQALGRIDVSATGITTDRMAGFEARRRAGRGRFLTRDDLEKNRDRQLTEVVVRLGGSLRIVRNQSEAYLVTVLQQAAGSLREVPAGCQPPVEYRQSKQPFPAMELECGRLRGCLVQVFLDGVRIFGQGPERNETPPNLDELLVRNLEGVEFYSSPSRTPAEFQTMTAQCGTLVLWTRQP